MALTQGITGTGQTPAAGEVAAYDQSLNGKVITTICVRNQSTATGEATVRIPVLHGAVANTGATIAIGEREYFRVYDGAIDAVYISGATALVDWYPVAVTKS